MVAILSPFQQYFSPIRQMVGGVGGKIMKGCVQWNTVYG